MAQGGKGKLNYRCPLCFRRDIDMDMLFDREKDEYYCIRCSFKGTEDEVKVRNAETRRRYVDRKSRITDFGPRTETPVAGSPQRVPTPIGEHKTPAKSPRKTNVESR